MAASWECPSLPMIQLPMKESSKVTFLAVKPMIAAHYEEDPESFNDEIRQLDQLRELALRPSRDYNGCSVLRRYFAQLHLLRARFPPETIGQLPIDFAWKDVFTNTEYIQEGLQIEQASILYNICCLHSTLASRGRRDTEQEMKDAITHFQCAAGAYAYLDERFATSHASKDLGPEFVAFYKNLMLGQAQECFVEKSLKGVGRVKNNTVSKLAARVSDYYSQCLRPLEAEPCNIIAKKNKEWPKLLKMKTLYFQAISHFYQGAHSEEVGKNGEAIAWYQVSHQKLTSIGKVPRSLGEPARDAVKNFTSHVHEKLLTVKRQNDQVYHDSIPDMELLEPTQGADLVKAVAFHATDPKNLGTDIFGRLVPMGAYEAASVFSEEKAKLLRSIVSSVSEKNEELEQYLVSLNAGEIDKLKQDTPNIPSTVLEQHKLMQGKSMLVKKLHSDLQSLMELSTKVTSDLGDIVEKKKEENEGEENFQAKIGARTPSQVCAALWKDASNYQTYHNQASKSNTELKAMFSQHYQYLVLLSGPLASLQATVPKMTPMDAPEEDSSASERWEELMGKIDKMRQQRKMLVGQLREQINGDDITKTMVGHLGSDKEAFINDHMKRHRELADVIRQNLAAQDNILLAVTDVNACQVRVRQAAQELSEQQERLFTALTKAGGVFSVLQSKIGEGLSFYTRLHDNVSKLHKRVFEVVGTRSRERETVLRQKSPSPSPSPAPVPPRPPKKAELAGKPLPPGQQMLPPEQAELIEQDHNSVNEPPPVATVMSSVPPQPSATSLEEQLRDLERTQQHQLEQLSHPPSSQQVPGLAEGRETGQPSPAAAAGHGVSTGMLVSPDANQALLDLQMLLQPPGEEMAGLSEPIQPERIEQHDGQEVPNQLPSAAQSGQFLIGQPAQLPPQRPDKPLHLRSEDVVSMQLPLSAITSPPPSLEMSQPLLPQPSADTSLNLLVEVPQPLLPQPPSVGAPLPLLAEIQAVPTSTSSATLAISPEDGQTQPTVQGYTSEGIQTLLHPQAESYKSKESFGQTSLERVLHPVEGDQFPAAGRQLPTEGEKQLDKVSINTDVQAPQSPAMLPSHNGPSMSAILSTDSTMTTNSISRPIPAPVQSPPPTATNPPLPTSPVPSSEIPHPPSAPAFSPPPLVISHGEPAMHTLPKVEPVSFQPSLEQEGTPVSPSSSVVPSGVDRNEHERDQISVPQIKPLQPSTPYQLHRDTPTETVAMHNVAAHINDPVHGHHPEAKFGQDDLTSDQKSTAHSSAYLSHPSPSLSKLGPEFTLSHGIDTNLCSIAPVSMMPSLAPLSSISLPLSTTHCEDERVSKMELQLQQHKEAVEKKTIEVEEGRAQIADQRRQLESYKQQVALLQQQLSQLTTQQQKQEQEKVTVSGQQAVLMQLLQQQQGMFSQQQSQLESLSKVNEEHHKQLQDSEMKYRQALAVEQEQKSNLQNQVLQLNQEIQRLHHQIQGQAQQQQTAQMQVYQYHTQIQERDKQLLAFRDQHKEIVQKLEQKHQEKVAQLIQQIQELQISLKKSREQQKMLQGGLTTPLQPTRIDQQLPQQFQRSGLPPQQQLLPQQQQPLPPQPQPLPPQPQPLPPQPRALPPQSQPLPQQPQQLPQQQQISQGGQVPGTPTSVQHQQGIHQPSSQPMSQQRPPSQPHSTHQPLPPTSAAWPMGSQGLLGQSRHVYHNMAPGAVLPTQSVTPAPGPSPSQGQLSQQQVQPGQRLTQPSSVGAPGNRPRIPPSHPTSQSGPAGGTPGGQGQFPPPTGPIGYPQFPSGQQGQVLPQQTQFPTFPPGTQFPSQSLPAQQPRQ